MLDELEQSVSEKIQLRAIRPISQSRKLSLSSDIKTALGNHWVSPTSHKVVMFTTGQTQLLSLLNSSAVLALLEVLGQISPDILKGNETCNYVQHTLKSRGI